MKRFKGELLGFGLSTFLAALLLSGCQVPGLEVSDGEPGSTTYVGITEIASPGTALYVTDTPTTSVPTPYGGSISVAVGGSSWVNKGPSGAGANRYGIQIGGAGAHAPGPALVLGPFSWFCPSGTCTSPALRGVGGSQGDFRSDYFLRYQGYRGPSASDDYSSLQIAFAGERDVRGYQGVVFWARGNGNFAVNLMADQGAGMPYSGWNYFLRRFGSELNGATEWKEIIVYFDQTVQEYGLAADRSAVLARMKGLQFDQQAPYTPNFQLDLDYVRFF